VQTTSVSVQDSNFNPSAIQVSPGATVTWTWAGSLDHNVIWVSGGLANSTTKASGTHQVTMPTTPGELVYYCSLHGSPNGGMRGTVRVQ
jgi:plastocyanin